MNITCDVVTTLTRRYLPYLSDCVESIRKQTVQDWKLHLVCDGEISLAEEVAREYAHDPRIQVYGHDQILGSYVSIMRIYPHLKSEILVIQDADDLALPHRLEATLPAFQDPAIAAFDAAMLQFIDPDNRGDRTLQMRYAKSPVRFPGYQNQGGEMLPLLHGTLAIRKEVFAACNGYEDWFCGADTDLGERLRRLYPIHHSTDVIALRRLHRRSLTNDEQFRRGSHLRTQAVEQIQHRMENHYRPNGKLFGSLAAR